ncbi:MAG: hypothetical protein Q8941_08205 [Bacteroidota bacterium]|nr:hypothetical protein [Bacteroidota bacterium]
MKRILFSRYIIRYFSIIPLLVFSMIPGQSIGQMDSMANMTTSHGAGEAAVSPLVDFISIQKSNNTIDLKATFKAKIKGNVTKLPGLMLRFLYVEDSVEKELGQAMTDMSGIGIFNCKADALTPGKDGKLHFKVSFAGDKSVDAAEEVVAVKRAKLTIEPVKEDSVLSVKLKLVDLAGGTETAIPDVNLGVFVRRLFSPLKLGEGKTDANGEISVEIPNTLSGDAKGNIILLARMDDNEQYGNLEASVIQPWGKPVSDEIKELPRALWSNHPPLWMLITFIILMTAVWGHYIVILYELFRLRKEHV